LGYVSPVKIVHEMYFYVLDAGTLNRTHWTDVWRFR